MALAQTILATLVTESYRGYELWKKFYQTSRYYRQEIQQQIYRELGKLEKEGALASEIIPQEGRPDKKLYKITDKGIEILKTWFARF